MSTFRSSFVRPVCAVACLISVSGAPTRAAGAPAANADDPANTIPVVTAPEIWKDPAQPTAARVRDLVSRMSLEEKVSLMSCNGPAIPRLGIPAYSHRNECLHGVGADGIATIFPQAIGMAATWDTPLIHEEADVIATEARAKHNDYVAKHDGNSGEHAGLTFYSPNINIFRDPRWGRGQETYGEDPFLTSRFAVAFIRGLQGDDPKYIKAMACAKHFAVHSGPESLRRGFDAKPPERDLYETYLPAFEAAVREGHVGSVMGAYSALNGVPDCANQFLLTDILRNQWGFDGFVTSDGGAIWDIWAEHKYAPTPQENVADAVKAGCDLCSGAVTADAPALLHDPANWKIDADSPLRGGGDFYILPQAVKQGLISENEIDTAVSRELTARFRVGLFDPPAMVPWCNIGLDQSNTPQHRQLALKVAQESIVLLKNDGILPLDRAKIKHIAVIGPNARSADMQRGNYSGKASRTTTIIAGIRQVAGADIDVTFSPGCPLAVRSDKSDQPTPDMTAKAIDAAKAADLVIFVGGLDSTLEREEGRAKGDFYDDFYRGDRKHIELPPVQEDLLKLLHDTGKPVIFVNCSGSAIAMPWEAEHLPAIVQAWYPGEEGGTAVAQVLFGDTNPAGRLPITIYASTSDLPPFEDYSMANRTYRYFTGKPLFAFGHGLSYTHFDYADAKLDAGGATSHDTLKISFTVRNTGNVDGDEVPQIYFRHIKSPVPQPQIALCSFARVHLAKNSSTTVTLEIPAQRFRYWDTNQRKYVVDPGDYELLIGGASDDVRLHIPVNVAAG